MASTIRSDVIVGTSRADERGVREALEAAGVSREFVYNRAALMLLPAGIDKGQGVEHVLRSFELSFQDALALGDAENDLALFEVCAWAACPGNAIPEAKTRADWVFCGENGESVAAAITGPIIEGLLPARHSLRHRIPVGWVVETSELATIPARDVNVLIYGDPLSGKSWLAGALIERLLAARYAVCVLDPEGDYRVLADLPSVIWAEVCDRAALDRALTQFARDVVGCLVVDLSALPHPQKLELIRAVLQWIRESRRSSGLPHWVLLDEAHYWLHREGITDDVIGIEEKGFCLATYRPSWLRDSVVKQLDVFILAHATADDELAFVRSRLSNAAIAEGALTTLPRLPTGEFLIIEREGEGRAVSFVAAPCETTHVRHLRKYADSRVPFAKRFLFRRPDGQVVAEAQSLHDFRRVLMTVDDHVITHHARRGDFSRWVLGVFSDLELTRQLKKTEARWRRGEILDLRRAIDRLITFRYGTDA